MSPALRHHLTALFLLGAAGWATSAWAPQPSPPPGGANADAEIWRILTGG